MSRKRVLPLHALSIFLHPEPVGSKSFSIFLMSNNLSSNVFAHPLFYNFKHRPNPPTHHLPLRSLILQYPQQNRPPSTRHYPRRQSFLFTALFQLLVSRRWFWRDLRSWDAWRRWTSGGRVECDRDLFLHRHGNSRTRLFFAIMLYWCDVMYRRRILLIIWGSYIVFWHLVGFGLTSVSTVQKLCHSVQTGWLFILYIA